MNRMASAELISADSTAASANVPGVNHRFVEANAAALRRHLPADLVFTNHVLLGAPVGAAKGMVFGPRSGVKPAQPAPWRGRRLARASSP